MTIKFRIFSMVNINVVCKVLANGKKKKRRKKCYWKGRYEIVICKGLFREDSRKVN